MNRNILYKHSFLVEAEREKILNFQAVSVGSTQDRTEYYSMGGSVAFLKVISGLSILGVIYSLDTEITTESRVSRLEIRMIQNLKCIFFKYTYSH